MPRDKRPGPRPFGAVPRRHSYAIPGRQTDFDAIKRGAKVRLPLSDQVRVVASGATMICGGKMVQAKGGLS